MKFKEINIVNRCAKERKYCLLENEYKVKPYKCEGTVLFAFDDNGKLVRSPFMKVEDLESHFEFNAKEKNILKLYNNLKEVEAKFKTINKEDKIYSMYFVQSYYTRKGLIKSVEEKGGKTIVKFVYSPRMINVLKRLEDRKVIEYLSFSDNYKAFRMENGDL